MQLTDERFSAEPIRCARFDESKDQGILGWLYLRLGQHDHTGRMEERDTRQPGCHLRGVECLESVDAVEVFQLCEGKSNSERICTIFGAHSSQRK